MCLITFHIAQHPTYKLVLAANRDEAYDRPTKSAQFWETYPGLLAGKDLEANGTWLGITRDGKLAAITNCHDGEFFEAATPPKKSRGKIVMDYLTSNQTPEQYLEILKQNKMEYQPFNILLGTVDNLYHFNSRDQNSSQLPAGIHSVSNAALNTPWSKVVNTKRQLEQFSQEGKLYTEQLMQMMMDSTPAPDEELPNVPLPLEMRRKTSATFIQSETFGTRCTTILLVDWNNQVTFTERNYRSDGTYADKRFEFQLET